MRNYLLLTVLFLLWHMALGQEAAFEVRGTVYSQADGKPIPGAVVSTADGKKRTVSDEDGLFKLMLSKGKITLEVNYLGMATFSESIDVPLSDPLEIRLSSEGINLEGVEVVSTGYQEIPKERATGSFVLVDNELINRRVSTNLIDRLEDVTPGLIFNRGANAASDPINIRGRSTLFANTAPLIIVDGFPYDGPLESINPNDVENISVLKDAAAASIWGARAGNGVIVVTTKSGKQGTGPQVSLNSNVTISEAPDPFYEPQMNIPDFLDIEKQLFEEGFYRSRENSSNRTQLPPMVETLIALRDGQISQAEADARIEQFANTDAREELERFYYIPAISQQYSLGIRGGGQQNTYAVSIGYDRNNASVDPSYSERWTLSGKQNWKLLNDRLNASAGIYLSKSSSFNGTKLPQAYAYESLTDKNGNPVAITGNLSTRYIASVADEGLLDWNFVPLEEIGLRDYRGNSLDWRANLGLEYQLGNGFSAKASYQYWNNSGLSRNIDPLESFYTRDLINRYTQRDENGVLSYPLPIGDILYESRQNSFSHTLRGQLGYEKSWTGKHFLNGIAGLEVKSLEGLGSGNYFYGYDDELGTGQPVDHMTSWPFYYNSGRRGAIDAGIDHSGTIDRFVSYYANIGYHFDYRYHLTLSARKDQSNIFGVDANQKGVPLWSVGTAWTISEENFAQSWNIPYLKLRATYGYNGNVDKSLSSMVTAQYYNFASYYEVPGARAATIINPPNPNLRWEKIGMANLALDMETKNGRFAGTVEYYRKKGSDLLGEATIASSHGMDEYKGNFSETLTKGVDVELRAKIINRAFQWRTSWMHSWVNEKVVNYENTPTVNNLLGSALGGGAYPMSGRPLFGIYTYHWAGLDPDTGDPLGYLDGEPSTEYRDIQRAATIDNLQYHGPSRPTQFGALRNDFSWKNFQLSVNISYRLGYYYMRRSIDYFNLLRGSIGHGDFDRRWQQPGDEYLTQIPSLPESADFYRHDFYMNSGVLVEKGDHIRLQDIRLSYSLNKDHFPILPFQRAEVYTYLNNVGMIWKVSDDPLDPDYRSSKPLRSFSIGLKVDF
ncbi:SusC/RagA family TonB-linked outer membrane protein [Echinicola sp. 20G]|uniref:SusC/RagA family TonB-linked outer membrane protein n=1 Tax=Echinicola sp. 20G TaxID=2781961 RepID=UPI00190FF05A|nr:SusC/RagA family TonB-linked outer membrane protein [Echinicola sp. 20G]